MDLKGYNTLTTAFAATDIQATVTPIPAEGEHLHFVTVEADESTVVPARVLNALGEAGLLDIATRDLGSRDAPKLSVVGLLPGSITFQDKNIPRR